MNRFFISLLALAAVFFILKKSELYTNLVLDTEWNKTRNTPRPASNPFETCSPESFGDCPKRDLPNLSRQ